MKFNRELLLGTLESVEPGLSKRELIEQSTCFVFDGVGIHTFNDEIAATAFAGWTTEEDAGREEYPLKGAVPAEPLLAILRKLEEDVIEIENINGELRFRGKNKKGGIRIENEIRLPLEAFEKPTPTGWRNLPDDFAEGVELVTRAASSNESLFALTCVRFHAGGIEATDRFQIAMWREKLEIEKPFLVRSESAKHLTRAGVTQYQEGAQWIHFTNPNGVILSLRRYGEEYPDLSKFIDFDGTPLRLPRDLKEVIDKALVFANENADVVLSVTLESGKVRVRGEGALGWYVEARKTEYAGPSISFTVTPTLLQELAEKQRDGIVSKDRMKFETGRFIYVTVLGTI